VFIKSCACLALLLVGLPRVAADVCQLRPPNVQARGVYAVVSHWSASELQLLVDEYAYRQKWGVHREAVEGGFLYGDLVFGETLTPEGVFNLGHVRAWKSEYANRRRKQYIDGLQPQLANYPLDRDLIQTVLISCLRSSLWTKLSATDGCHFTFTAGVLALQPSQQVLPVELKVSGGRCEAWPDRPLDTRGQMVQCVRSGNGSVTLGLAATHAATVQQMLPPLRARAHPPEPMLEQGMSKPSIEVLALYRARDYQAVGFGQSCPSCKLFAADFHPSRPDAVIVDVSVVSTADASRWLRCPASYRCGTPEFSPPDQRNVSGCSGLKACRVWRLSSEDAVGWDTIQITSIAPESVCANCPEGMDYAAAHKQWEEQSRAYGWVECSVFPDPPAQVFRQYLQDRRISPSKQ
jgi:hypothetical protein